MILLSALDFEGAEFGGWTGGEAVWAASVLRSAKALGYSVLFTMGLRETRRFYEVLGEFVKGELEREQGRESQRVLFSSGLLTFSWVRSGDYGTSSIF